jgi:hypothetical protein
MLWRDHRSHSGFTQDGFIAHEYGCNYNRLSLFTALENTETVKKVKLSRSMPWRHMGGEEVLLRQKLILGTRWGWVVSVTPRPRFTPGERTPGTHWIGGWVGPRAGLDAGTRRKVLCPCRGLNHDRPARSQTLYCLSYRGSTLKQCHWKCSSSSPFPSSSLSLCHTQPIHGRRTRYCACLVGTTDSARKHPTLPVNIVLYLASHSLVHVPLATRTDRVLCQYSRSHLSLAQESLLPLIAGLRVHTRTRTTLQVSENISLAL